MVRKIGKKSRWDGCPNDESTAKNLVCRKALPIPEKIWKSLLGGGGYPLPPGHRRVKITLVQGKRKNYSSPKLCFACDSI